MYILYKYDYDLIWGFYYFDDFRGWEMEFINEWIKIRYYNRVKLLMINDLLYD